MASAWASLHLRTRLHVEICGAFQPPFIDACLPGVHRVDPPADDREGAQRARQRAAQRGRRLSGAEALRNNFACESSAEAADGGFGPTDRQVHPIPEAVIFCLFCEVWADLSRLDHGTLRRSSDLRHKTPPSGGTFRARTFLFFRRLGDRRMIWQSSAQYFPSTLREGPLAEIAGGVVFLSSGTSPPTLSTFPPKRSFASPS